MLRFVFYGLKRANFPVEYPPIGLNDLLMGDPGDHFLHLELRFHGKMTMYWTAEWWYVHWKHGETRFTAHISPWGKMAIWWVPCDAEIMEIPLWFLFGSQWLLAKTLFLLFCKMRVNYCAVHQILVSCRKKIFADNWPKFLRQAHA